MEGLSNKENGLMGMDNSVVNVGGRELRGLNGNGKNTTIKLEMSGQNGGVGRHTLPPRITKRRTTTNLKQKITGTARKSNCMKVRQPRC